MDERERSRHLRCSFCGKRPDQVRKLVAGPGVYICDLCIRLCNEILDEDSRPGGGGGRCEQPPRRGGWKRTLSWRRWRVTIGPM